MESKISKEVITQHGLSEDEYKNILTILRREPNLVELGIFSAMWSEHCSYKSSRVHLKNLPTTGPQVILGPGENAGVVDIGDGQAVVFKVESHNHPSFIEPYNGAATGVGGILRDIFTMGARPLAVLNSLRFGSPEHFKTKFLIDGVVSGISGYGNRMGIPNLGGEMSFDDCYNGNNLVNAFALGIVKADKIFKGAASGVGNPVIYLGSKTGRDGIHGATMASEEFDEESEDKKPTVQVGDPFIEKLLLEACLELMKTDYIVGIQDMGAAGLTCSVFEMADRAGMGIDLNLNSIPMRETGMIPYEIMLSESQERMLLVAKKGSEEKIFEIFNKYDLDASIVGTVTDTGRVCISFDNEIVADLPVKELSDSAPQYNRPIKRPDSQDDLAKFDIKDITELEDYSSVLLQMIGSLELSSREWVYQQYDHIVRTNSIVLPGSDAAVIRLKENNKAIAMSADCNSRYCYLNPYIGGMAAVAESARNVVCSGAKPLAISDCLNFGNPEKPEIMWQFVQALKGISEACKEFNTPIISGNVSFYNETNNISIYPTPVITMVGLLDDYTKVCTQWFKEEGDIIVLIGENLEELGGTEYLKQVHNLKIGTPPNVDLEKEKALQSTCLETISKRIIKSAHDCSDGGLAIALAECCISGDTNIGAEVSLDDNIRTDALLFGESHSRVIITLENKDINEVINIAARNGIRARIIGKVGYENLRINCREKNVLDVDVEKMFKIWKKSIPEFMEG